MDTSSSSSDSESGSEFSTEQQDPAVPVLAPNPAPPSAPEPVAPPSAPALPVPVPQSEPLTVQPPGQDSACRKRKSGSEAKKYRKRARRQANELALHSLAAQVTGIQNFLSQQYSVESVNNVPDNDSDVSLDVSGELYETPDVQSQKASQATDVQSQPDVQLQKTSQVPREFSISVNTVLKEPTMPKSDPSLVDRLNSLQHFDTDFWSDVRYADVQKKYSSTPGFTDLDCNDEIKPFDKFSNLAVTEKGFAAITQALLKLQDAVETGFRTLLTWLASTEIVEINAIEEKIKEIFAHGDYQKISSDLLQIVCGHRADLIQQRRDAILKSVKDKFVKASLRKIPPSRENLFKAESFTAAIDKQGGVNKVFWPSKAQSANKSTTATAAQAGPSQPNKKAPAQGVQPYVMPHGIRAGPPAHGVPFNPFIPAQGIFPLYNQAMVPYPMRLPAQGPNFRPRAPRPQAASQRNAKSRSSRRGQAKQGY